MDEGEGHWEEGYCNLHGRRREDGFVIGLLISTGSDINNVIDLLNIECTCNYVR